MKKLLTGIVICSFTLSLQGLPAMAIEPVGQFIIKDIQYQNLQDRMKLTIVMNTYIECISYELEKPHRIVIDPLEEVYCDYQDKVYFEEGLIESIEFIKSKKTDKGPGEPYYAFDFLVVQLRETVPYKVIKEGPSILLDIGEVMENQRDLVKITQCLRPITVVKG